MCVFTDKRIKAIAFALVPIVAINVYVGSKMLKKASEKIEVGNQPSIEEMVDQNIIHGGIPARGSRLNLLFRRDIGFGCGQSTTLL